MADKRVIKTGFRKVLTDSLRDCQRVNSNHPITLILKSQEPKSRLISIKTAPVQKGHSLLSSYVATGNLKLLDWQYKLQKKYFIWKFLVS